MRKGSPGLQSREHPQTSCYVGKGFARKNPGHGFRGSFPQLLLGMDVVHSIEGPSPYQLRWGPPHEKGMHVNL